MPECYLVIKESGKKTTHCVCPSADELCKEQIEAIKRMLQHKKARKADPTLDQIPTPYDQ